MKILSREYIILQNSWKKWKEFALKECPLSLLGFFICFWGKKVFKKQSQDHLVLGIQERPSPPPHARTWNLERQSPGMDQLQGLRNSGEKEGVVFQKTPQKNRSLEQGRAECKLDYVMGLPQPLPHFPISWGNKAKVLTVATTLPLFTPLPIVASPLFPKHARYTPASGPLHWLFSL